MKKFKNTLNNIDNATKISFHHKNMNLVVFHVDITY